MIAAGAAARDRIEIAVEEWLGEVVLPPELNLVTRAIRLLRAEAGGDGPLQVSLFKRIPLGAGLGGGSADAAASLKAAAELWALELDAAELERLGGSLGSDVPFCLGGGSALATGRGEILTPVAVSKALTFVLGLSARPLATAQVYRARRPETSAPAVEPLLSALTAADPARVAPLLHNDLEPAAFELRPELEASKAALLEAGALGACLSGSGPTLVGLVLDERHGREVAAGIERRFDRVEVVTSRPAGVERLGSSGRQMS